MNKKTCALHALLLAVVACIIALTFSFLFNTGELPGDHNKDSADTSIEQSESLGPELVIEFEAQNTASRIVQIIFDFLIAFTGGIVGLKVWSIKNKTRNYLYEQANE